MARKLQRDRIRTPPLSTFLWFLIPILSKQAKATPEWKLAEENLEFSPTGRVRPGSREKPVRKWASGFREGIRNGYFDEDIPHANIRERWSETANWETQSRIFFATLPITLIGSGVSTYTEFSESSLLFTEPLYLQATGLSETDATAVSDAWNAGHRDIAQSLLRSAYQTADFDQSHVARIRQQADAKLQLAAEALRQRTSSLERSRQLPTLHSISDSQHQIRLPDGRTIDYPTREEADSARWQWAKDNGLDLNAPSQELSDIKDGLARMNDVIDVENSTEQAPVAPPLNLEYLHEDEPRSQRESPNPGQTAETLRHVAGRSDGTNAEKRSEAEPILQTAFQEDGLILDPGKLKERLTQLKKLAGRNEHTVYHDPTSDRVIKLTNPNEAGAAESAYEYFAQRQQSNDRFGDDMRVEGIVDFGDGWQIVTSQPFIRGRNTTANERAEYFSQMGFEPIRDDAYYNPSTETIITDADGTNVLIDQDGDLFPIDVYVSPVESFHQQNLYEEQLERTRAERREREAFEAQFNDSISSDNKLDDDDHQVDSDPTSDTSDSDSDIESSHGHGDRRYLGESVRTLPTSLDELERKLTEVQQREDQKAANRGPLTFVKRRAANVSRVEEFMKHVRLEKSARGKITGVKIDSNDPKLQRDVSFGISFVESLVVKDLLRHNFTIVETDLTENSIDLDSRTIFVSNKMSSTSRRIGIAHEIIHLIERENPKVLQQVINFLLKRAGTETAIRFNEIDPRYKPYVIGFRDDWVGKKGDRPYPGRIYLHDMSKADMSVVDVTRFDLSVIKKDPLTLQKFKRRIKATETLTDAMTRLLDKPEDFYTRDPEYFRFAIGIFQNLQ